MSMFRLWYLHVELKEKLWHLRTLEIGNNNEEHAKQLRQMADELVTLENAMQILQENQY